MITIVENTAAITGLVIRTGTFTCRIVIVNATRQPLWFVFCFVTKINSTTIVIYTAAYCSPVRIIL